VAVPAAGVRLGRPAMVAGARARTHASVSRTQPGFVRIGQFTPAIVTRRRFESLPTVTMATWPGPAIRHHQ
jgi:hypothetical protein